MPTDEPSAAEPNYGEGTPISALEDKPRGELRIEDVWGQFMQVTAVPTWVPKTIKESYAFNTTKGEFYYYETINNVWRTLTGTGSIGRYQLKIIDENTVLTTGDGKLIILIPAYLNGANLIIAHAFVSTVSSSGLPTVQIRNVTQAADMLTTKITIDANEFTSYSAATQPVIDTANDDVATGDLIAIDVDVAGTGAKGLGVHLEFSF